MTNKLFILCFFVCTLNCYSQDNNTEVLEIIPAKTQNDSHTYVLDENSNIKQRKFERNFKEKYKFDKDYIYNEEETDGLWTQIKRKIAELKRDFYELFKFKKSQERTVVKLLKIGSFLVLGILLFFIIRAFIQKEIFWFIKKKKKNIKTLYDEIEQDLENINFVTLIDKTIKAKDPRLAIRYYYLWILQTMSKGEIIQWELEKTNSDYLLEIKDEEIRNEFKYLSYLYNNIWYGEFEIDMESFAQAQTSFESFLKQLKYE